MEVTLILVVLLLLFGAKKLPELARGTGRALRIFKSETKGLMDDDDDATSDSTRTDSTGATSATAPAQIAQVPTVIPPPPVDTTTVSAASPLPPTHVEQGR
ncbi:MAG: twin-arginine translocase TatA/TatE family subunit [Nocardioidaceae bacterium]